MLFSACFHSPAFVRIREKDKGQSYALTMSYHRSTKHYRIDKRKTSSGEVFAIEEGPTFENLMDVSGDLCCKETNNFVKLFVIL